LFLAFTLCAFLIYKQRRRGLWETWVWRVALIGYVLACAGVFVDYWTQWTSNYNVLFQVGWIMTVPGLLLTMVGRRFSASPSSYEVRRPGCQPCCWLWRFPWRG
jgi:hypothetical protein